jgi:NAD(P)-dependent dehydrogenase (short-subunit alcohol dehydrogenase family)
VVVNYHSSSAAAEATVHEIEKLGRRAVAVQADVFGQEGVDILQAQAAAFFGTAADILVCNAGGLNQRGEL